MCIYQCKSKICSRLNFNTHWCCYIVALQGTVHKMFLMIFSYFRPYKTIFYHRLSFFADPSSPSPSKKNHFMNSPKDMMHNDTTLIINCFIFLISLENRSARKIAENRHSVFKTPCRSKFCDAVLPKQVRVSNRHSRHFWQSCLWPTEIKIRIRVICLIWTEKANYW